jgi:Mrp family chromosome partitioning ATPase
MVVAPDVDPRWGADVSLLIARELSAKGRKILLADASFERPVLHEAAGVANGEGI